MKKIGIVGGMAWLSTVDFYSELCRLACTELPLAFPEHVGAQVFNWDDRLYVSSTAIHIHAAFAAATAA